MSILQRVICDNCQTDITTNNGSLSSRYVLYSEKVQDNTYIEPITEGKIIHFCSLTCLKEWVEKIII